MRSSHDELDIPRAVLLAWNAAPATTKGPKPRWTLDQILDAAVRLGDEGGIEAITMSGLAKALGSGTMSLYRYIESREDLVILATDRALGSLPAPEGATWRERLRAWALDLRRVYLEHPWLAAVPVGTEPLLPSYIRRLETGVACLVELDLAGDRAITILTLLWTYTRGEVEQSVQLADAVDEHSPEEVNRFFAERLRALGGGEDFPRLLGALEAERPQAAAAVDDEAEFLDAIEIILNGVEVGQSGD